MKIILIIMVMMVLSPFAIGDNTKLVAGKIKELKALNNEILKQIKDVEKYNNKKIYVKVRVLPRKGKNKTVLKVEKVSVNKIDKDPKDVTGKFIYLSGVVEKVSDDSKYKVDLSHVLPPEKDTKKVSVKKKIKKGGEKK